MPDWRRFFEVPFNCLPHECWKQGAAGAAKVVGGSLGVVAGVSACGTGGGCVIGPIMVTYGASEAWQGGTAVVDAFQGITSEGFNPVRAAESYLFPTWGGVFYDIGSIGTGIAALTVKVPLIVGATDGIKRAEAIFGSTIIKWNNTNALKGLLTGSAGQTINRATAVGSTGYGVYSVSKEITKTRNGQ